MDAFTSDPFVVVVGTILLTACAVVWAVFKSRAERLELTQKAHEQERESLHREIERLSTFPPPPPNDLVGRLSLVPPAPPTVRATPEALRAPKLPEIG